MFQRRALDRIEERQQETMEVLQTVVAGLIASDPRTPMSVDAYNGLRRQVATAAQERRRMLLQLIEMSEWIDRGATVETLRDRCGQWSSEAGLRRIDDPAEAPDLFDFEGGEAPAREVIEPAWFDTAGDFCIRRGRAIGTPPRPEPEPEAEQPEAAEAAEAPAEAEATPSESEPAEPETAEQHDEADETSAEERR